MRLILLVLIIAGVAGYFTRPDEPTMREAANQVLRDPQSISEGIESAGAAIAGDRLYTNYYVAAKYDVALSNDPLVSCWGGFTQVMCNRVAAPAN